MTFTQEAKKEELINTVKIQLKKKFKIDLSAKMEKGIEAAVFADSLALAVNYSQAFKVNEEISVKLKQLNKNLKSIVAERTKELSISNKKIQKQKDELEKANAALQKMSQIDPLTNVWNRRYFDKALVQEWQQALQKERSLSLMFIDIDDFKVYNDYYGHRAGDECLQKVATTIKKATDYKGSIVARYGGEEFVVLLPDINIDHPAARIARTVRQKVADLNIPQAVNSNWEWVTISLGLASLIPNDKFLPEDLVLAADKAMYSAKEDGKNQIKINPVKIQATN